jgi:hypothetical protein
MQARRLIRITAPLSLLQPAEQLAALRAVQPQEGRQLQPAQRMERRRSRPPPVAIAVTASGMVMGLMVARPPQLPAQQMEDRQLRRRRAAMVVERQISVWWLATAGRQAQLQQQQRCWAEPRPRPRPRRVAMEVQLRRQGRVLPALPVQQMLRHLLAQ